MLSTIGLESEEDLIAHLPTDVRFNGRLAIEDGKSEYEIVDYFKQMRLRTAMGTRVFSGPACTITSGRY
jgi:glycine cleavage system pyridoxal-binding protein P